MLSVTCLYSVCLPFIFHFFSFPLSCPPDSFNVFTSFMYLSFFHYKFFYFWCMVFVFLFFCCHQNCAVIFLSILFIHSLPAVLSTLFTLPRPSPHPAAPLTILPPLPSQKWPPILNGICSTFLYTSMFRHILLPATAPQNYLSSWISQMTIFLTPMLMTLRRFGLCSIIPDFRGDICLFCELGCGNGWDLAWTWTKIYSFFYSCLLNGSSSACNILWAVDLNEKMPDELGRLWP